MIRNKRRAIPNFFILLVLAIGIGWTFGRFIHWGNVEFTDNAQVKQHLTPVNTRVQGFIKRICFDEYQRVKKGDTLVIIEDTEYRLKVAQAEADYQSALAGKTAMHTTINTTQNNILVTDAAIEEQRVRLQNAEADFKRYEGLLKEEAVTPQQFDRVKTDYEATKARYEQLLRQKQSTSLVKQEQTQRLDQNESAIKYSGNGRWGNRTEGNPRRRIGTAGTDVGYFGRRYREVGDCQLQGNADHPNAERPAGRHPGGCFAGSSVRRTYFFHIRCNRFLLFVDSSGQFCGKLCESGTAYSCAYRIYSP